MTFKNVLIIGAVTLLVGGCGVTSRAPAAEDTTTAMLGRFQGWLDAAWTFLTELR